MCKIVGISLVKIPFWGNTVPLNGINSQPPSNLKIQGQLSSDKFESSSPMRYTSEAMIRKLSQNNNNVQKILANVGIPYSVNIDSLNELMSGHARDTQNIAEGIVNNLPFGLKQAVDLPAVKDGAYLHDIGKVFIPNEILYKNGKLDDKETEIVHAHSELGYELLKSTEIKPKVLHLIRNHHQNALKNGYPNVDKNFRADIELQIVSMADKYSALIEPRSYKPSMTKEQALTIIYSDVKAGKFNPLIFNALVNYTSNSSGSPITKGLVVNS